MRIVLTVAAAAAVLAPTPRSQSAWINLAPVVRPSPRCCMAVATDLSNGSIWLFGGVDGAGYQDDMWQHIAGAWTPVVAPVRPSPRYGAAMTTDSSRGAVVLFGGATNPGVSGETWEWNGSTWSLRSPPTAPSARYEHAMAFDLLRSAVVLYGGSTGGNETWEYDGATWTPRPSATVPPSMRGQGMAYHLSTGRVVMFGGNRNETWLWDGSDWAQALPAHVPPARIYAAMSEDLIGGRVFLFGGRPSYTNDMWEWGGLDWTQRQPPAPRPLGRAAMALAHDPVSGLEVLFGGNNLGLGARYDDTWMFQAASPSAFGFGTGCVGTAGTPALSAAPAWVGHGLELSLVNVPSGTLALFLGGLSNTDWNGIPLPIALDPLGYTGCSLAVRPDFSAAAFTAGGTAGWAASVPAGPTFVGLQLFFQAAVFDAGANPGGITGSNGVGLVLVAP